VTRTPGALALSPLAGLTALSLAGCSGTDRREDVAAIVEQVSEAELRRHVETLALEIGPRPPHEDATTDAAVAYLLDELQALGYEAREETYEAKFSDVERTTEADGTRLIRLLPLRDVRRANVIAELLGVEEPDSVLELGAHYDTVFVSPGADDNASGVAVVLEAARVLRDARCRRTIRFVLFASEEYDYGGSRTHVNGIEAAERERFLGLINLDGVGCASSKPGTQVELVPWWMPFPGLGKTGDFILDVGNSTSAALGNAFEDAVDAYVPELPYYSANRIGGRFKDAYRGDHARYWEADLPAILITDTGEFRNPNYHLTSDLPEALDYAFLRRVAQAVVATALHRAELD